jgi:hypothetical protein
VGTVPQKSQLDSNVPVLRDRLLAHWDLDSVSSDDLLLVRSDLKSAIPGLLSSRHYVQARNYILLSHEIQTTLAERASFVPPEPPPKPSPVIADFDSDTHRRVQLIRSRYRNLGFELFLLWSGKVQREYHRPSQRVRELRQAIKKYPDDVELSNTLKELEAEEREIAEVNFQTEYRAARDRLWRQEKIEVATFLKERRKSRTLLQSSIASNPNIRRISPSALSSPPRRPLPPPPRPIHPRKTFQAAAKRKSLTFVTAPSAASSDSGDEREHVAYLPEEMADGLVLSFTPHSDDDDDENDAGERAGLLIGPDEPPCVKFAYDDSSGIFDSANPSAIQSFENLSVEEDDASPEMSGLDALPEMEGVQEPLPEIADQEALPEMEGVQEALPEMEGVQEALPETEGVQEALPEMEGVQEEEEEEEEVA